MIGFLAAIISLAPAYLIRLNIQGLPTTLLEVLIVAFLFLTLFQLNNNSLNKIKKLGQINYAIGLFVLAGIISIFVSPDHTKALGQLKAFILEPVFMFYAILITIKTRDRLNIVLKVLFGSSVLISLFGIFQYFSFIHLPIRFWGYGTEVERITSIFDYPNALSLYLAPLIGLFTALWVNEYAILKNRFVSLAGLVVMATALLLTFSRGAWLALAVGIFLILLQKYKAKMVILPALILVALLVLIPSVRQRLSVGVSDPSSSAHLDLMQAGVEQITHHPIFGRGLAGFGTLNLGVEYPHNIILNFWVQMGLLGLLAFGWIIFLCIQRYKKHPQPLILAAGIYLLILLVHGLVDVPYFKNDLSLLFWFAVALFYL